MLKILEFTTDIIQAKGHAKKAPQSISATSIDFLLTTDFGQVTKISCRFLSAILKLLIY
jgi:hypothetical protein